MFGKHIGVGCDDAKKIVERVSNDLGFGGGGGGVGNVESDLHGRSLSGMRSGLSFGNASEKGGAERFGTQTFDGQATAGTALGGLQSDIGGRGRMERKNGEGRVFGTDFVDVVEALEVPGLDIDGSGVPFAAGENEEKLVERLRAMDFEIRRGRVREGGSDFGPGEVLAQKENMKR